MKKSRTMAEHFGWRHHPFSDTRRLNAPFRSVGDRRVADQAVLLLQQGKSFAVTGPSGTGKSTLVEDLLANLDANYYCKVYVHYGGLQRVALLKAIGEQLGVETNGRAVPLLTRLQNHISTLANGSHPVYPVICIDDAQLLERQSFMDLCSLVVCAPKKTVVASIVLAGDEMLARQLSLAIMIPVRSRMTASFTAEPLGEEETEEFVAFRLKNAEAPEDLFEPDALKLLAANCRGNRRNIMNMATLLLNEAYCREERTVSARLLTSSELVGRQR